MQKEKPEHAKLVEPIFHIFSFNSIQLGGREERIYDDGKLFVDLINSKEIAQPWLFLV